MLINYITYAYMYSYFNKFNSLPYLNFSYYRKKVPYA